MNVDQIAQNEHYVPEAMQTLEQNTYLDINNAVKAIHPIVISMMDVNNVSSMSRIQLTTHVQPVIQEAMQRSKLKMEPDHLQVLEQKLIDELLGLGPIQPLINDDSVNDILVNSYKQVYVERNGELQPTHIQFWSEQHLMTIVSRILSRVNRRVDETSPFANARLPDGSRVNVVIPPLSPQGPIISIRKFQHEVMQLSDMVEQMAMTAEMAELLKIAVRSKLNIIFTGGTGAGKTTLLNAASEAIDSNERIITIEDTCELLMKQPHHVQLEARAASIEGKGGVELRDLFINALRMRPDRIIVGEARGAEVFEMLQAMNTGHDGSMSTIHASACEEVPMRIANMVSLTGFNYPHTAVLQQIADCLDLIVEVQRLADGRRVVTRIAEVTGMKDGRVQFQDIMSADFARDSGSGMSVSFKAHKVTPKFMPRVRRAGLEDLFNGVMKNAR